MSGPCARVAEPSPLQPNQQFSPARFHRRRARSSSLAQNLNHSRSNTRVVLRQVGQPLKSEGPDNGTAVFQISNQQRSREISLLGVEQQSRNHRCEMPSQFLLFGLSHQTEQFSLVGLE